MAQTYPAFIWHNGRVKPWAEATVHVMAHALHYGSSVFEGIRSYETPNGPAIFRLTDHIKRLFASAKIYDMAIPYTLAQLNAASREVIKANGLTKAYLRPLAFRGLGGFGLSADTPTDVIVAAWQMGAYLGAGVLEQGIDACVSSWQRFAPNTIPAGAKAGGNYLSGQLIAREARRLGFGEGIALASTGLLSEGAGENLFLVFDGALHTPPVSPALLNGITRNTIMTLAGDDGIKVVERDIPREYLYLADEVFMCGTAAEITPIRSVDGKPGRRRQARPGHAAHAGAVLRPVHRTHAGQVRLARTALSMTPKSRCRRIGECSTSAATASRSRCRPYFAASSTCCSTSTRPARPTSSPTRASSRRCAGRQLRRRVLLAQPRALLSPRHRARGARLCARAGAGRLRGDPRARHRGGGAHDGRAQARHRRHAVPAPAGPISIRDVIYGFADEIERSGHDWYAHKTGFSRRSLNWLLNSCGFPFVFGGVGFFELVAYAFKALPEPWACEALQLPDAAIEAASRASAQAPAS